MRGPPRCPGCRFSTPTSPAGSARGYRDPCSSRRSRIGKTSWRGRDWCSTCPRTNRDRSEEHTSELQSHSDLVCRLLLEKKKKTRQQTHKYRVTKFVSTITRN